MEFMEAKKWSLFSEYRLEGNGYPIEQNCLFGAKLANFVPGKQEGLYGNSSDGDPEEGFDGVVAPSLKAVKNLDVSKLVMMDLTKAF